MTTLDRPARALAFAVAMLAGFTDAVGYLASRGFFVSFMSGNSTRMGVGMARHAHAALIAGTLIGGFVAGATLGFLIGRRNAKHQQTAVLALVGLLLGAATLVSIAVGARIGLILLAGAMGAVNALFEEGGEVRIGLTYMTGTLVKIGQRVAHALQGGPRWGWVPFAILWAGLITGGALGATAYLAFGLVVLWVPTATALLLAAFLFVRPVRAPATH